MSRETVPTNKIALLATGDEICNGDILNTNAQEIARRLFSQGMPVGMHLTTSDNIAEIEQAIRFLLKTHSALIITGGLGPTSDDLTRYALSNAVNRPLIFHENVWEDIVNRLKRFGYLTPPISNRQQALFPEGAEIISNPNGTAAGCQLEHESQLMFMLPGPPVECLPMFEHIVLPQLKKSGFQQIEYYKNWLLFGVSEGQIAEELDALAKPYDCMTGYRLFYPYIEFKLHSNRQADFDALIPQIEKTIKPYLIGLGDKMASELLRYQLETLNTVINISDHATGGLLESLIKTPKNYRYLKFSEQENKNQQITIKGLAEFWQGDDVTQTTLEIYFDLNGKQELLQVETPFRGYRVKQYAVEFICWKIWDFLLRCG